MDADLAQTTPNERPVKSRRNGLCICKSEPPSDHDLPHWLSGDTPIDIPTAFEVQQTFPFMDLPVELRLHVYKYLFVPGLTYNSSPIRSHVNEEHALLLTARQIRNEALPIFYRNNRFVFELPERPGRPRYVNGVKYKGYEAVIVRFTNIKINIKDVRYICFRRRNDFGVHDIHINLTEPNSCSWLIPSGTETQVCQCQARKHWTLQQWRKRVSDDTKLRPRQHYMILFRVDEYIDIARDFLKKFRKLCVSNGVVSPTIKGVDLLARPASIILRGRSH